MRPGHEVNMTRFIITTVLLLFTGAGVAGADMSMDVTPLRVQVRMDAGAEYTNAVRVTNSGEEPLRLRAYLEDWYLDEVGTPVFRPAGSMAQTASLWVETAPSDLLLNPGETEFVRFTVRVPGGMDEGAFHTSLILENVPLNRADVGPRQVFIRGRVACMLYVTVGEPERSAEIKSLVSLERDGNRYLMMQVENTGEDFIRLAGAVNFLAGNKDVGDHLIMPDVPVLPGARRWVEFEVTPEQFTRNSLARVTVDLGDAGTLIGECPLATTSHRAQ